MDDINRDISATFTSVSSLNQCQDTCSGFKYFALQNGNACFCGNGYSHQSKYAKVADSECNVVGNALGGPLRNSVFKHIEFTKTIDISQYMGCYFEIDGGGKAMQFSKGQVSSIYDCQDLCADFPFFAMQSLSNTPGDQCWCGYANYNTKNGGYFRKLDDSECITNNKNRALFWGGHFRNAVFMIFFIII